MGCCEKLCRSLIVAINTTVVIAALALLGVSIYLLVETYAYDKFNVEGLPRWWAWIPFGIAVILAAIGGVGCRSALHDNKGCIGFYGFIMLLFGVLILLCGAAFVIGVEAFSTVAATENANQLGQTNALGAAEQGLGDTTTGIYYTCCAPDVPLPLICDASTNQAVPCSDMAPNKNGTMVSKCFCVFDQNTFVAGAAITAEGCKGLVDAGVKCPSIAGSEPQGRQLYQQDLETIFRTSFFTSGIVLVVIGSILFLASIGSFYLCCCAGSSNAPKNQQAGATAGTYQQANTQQQGLAMA